MANTPYETERAELKAAIKALSLRLDQAEQSLLSRPVFAIDEMQSGHESATLPQSIREQKRPHNQLLKSALITDEMIRAGVDAFSDWEEHEHPLEDWVCGPSAGVLVLRILERCLPLRQ